MGVDLLRRRTDRAERDWRLSGFALGSLAVIVTVTLVWVVLGGPSRLLVAALLALGAVVVMRREPVAIRVSPEIIVLDYLIGRPRSFLVATIRLELPTLDRAPYVVWVVDRTTDVRVAHWSMVRRPLWIEAEARSSRIPTTVGRRSRTARSRRELYVHRVGVDGLLFLVIVVGAGVLFDWVLAYTLGSGALIGLALSLPLAVSVSSDRVVVYWLMRPRTVLAGHYARVETPVGRRGRLRVAQPVRVVDAAKSAVVARVLTFAEEPALAHLAVRRGVATNEVPRR